MASIIARHFVAGLALGIAAVPISLLLACALYARHRVKNAGGRQVHIAAFIVGLLIAGVLAGYAGIFAGAAAACPEAGNLCGLFGVLVTGPIFASAGFLLIGIATYLVPAR